MKRACIIGYPVAHSRSPLIHNYWIDKYSLNGIYVKESVSHETIVDFISSLREKGYVGGNVTIPHKHVPLQIAARVEPEAQAIGAANTLWFEDGQLIAGNTDAYGFITHLDEQVPDWRADLPAVVLGAGGAARAVLYALLRRSVPEIRLLNRTREKAERLANEFGPAVQVADWQTRSGALAGCGLLVNTTSLGMAGGQALEIDLAALPSAAAVYDIVYVPLQTALLEAARARGLRTVDGLGMLLHQAVPGFARWFGVRPQVTAELHHLVAQDILRG